MNGTCGIKEYIQGSNQGGTRFSRNDINMYRHRRPEGGGA